MEFLDLLYVNIPFILAVILLIIRVYKSTKRGMVQEICSLIAMIAGCFVIVVLAFAIRNYINEEKVIFVVTLFLLAIFGLIYKLFTGLLEAIKLVSKLPVINILDKVLGVVVGIAETVIVVWMVYCVVMIMDAGIIEESISKCVEANSVMSYLFNNNLIFNFFAPFHETYSEFDFNSFIYKYTGGV